MPKTNICQIDKASFSAYINVQVLTVFLEIGVIRQTKSNFHGFLYFTRTKWLIMKLIVLVVWKICKMLMINHASQIHMNQATQMSNIIKQYSIDMLPMDIYTMTFGENRQELAHEYIQTV